MRVFLILTIILSCALYAAAGTETILHTFGEGNDGYYPANTGSLYRDASGNLFGSTELGGSCDKGTVFELSRSGGVWRETILHNFCGTDGQGPYGDVVVDASGAIYGTTTTAGPEGCGTVFKLSGTTLTTLHSFTCGVDGGEPPAGVVFDQKGNLYGVAASGGANGAGDVFEISANGTFQVLYSFCASGPCLDGNTPYGGLIFDDQGNLYGTTSQGGPGSDGVVFELSEVNGVWKETVLHGFSGDDGSDPEDGSLLLVTQNVGVGGTSIYGVTSQGGPGNVGVAYELTRSGAGWTYHLLHNFSGEDGAYPYGTLLRLNGNLIGTTGNGGAYDHGTVFELSEQNDTWQEEVLFSFSKLDGAVPLSGVIADANGVLYGVAESGGVAGDEGGVAYQLTP